MVGVDEVGRGCWAGPLLVVAARKVKPLPSGLNDSKLLSRLQRETIFEKLVISCQFGEGWVTPVEIDEIGLADALRIGVIRSLNAIKVSANEKIIMDGNVNYVPVRYTKSRCAINADSTVPIVSAASVCAKVLRDRFMIELVQKYPKYGFEKHVGYGTTTHSAALKEHGVIDGIHRKSYKPVKKILEASQR
jgi:ribonuclease HII